MCGRYTLKTDRSKIEERFALEEVPDFPPRYNLAPTQDGLVVRPGEKPGTRTAALLRWGLVPSWTRQTAGAPLLINARAETAAERPAFREPFRRRRCLVVADGFYEWSRRSAIRQPYHFTVDHGALFAFAGLWDRWRPPGAATEDALQTFTILTTTANDALAPHHDRMPVILEPQFYDDWLNPMLVDAEAVRLMLRPFPPLRMLARAVTPRVNSIRNDDPACLEPAGTSEIVGNVPGPAGARNAGPPPLPEAGQLDLGLGD